MYIFEEIYQTARLQFRPNPKSSGLEVEANLDFKDKNFYSQSSSIKQGTIKPEITSYPHHILSILDRSTG